MTQFDPFGYLVRLVHSVSTLPLILGKPDFFLVCSAFVADSNYFAKVKNEGEITKK